MNRKFIDIGIVKKYVVLHVFKASERLLNGYSGSYSTQKLHTELIEKISFDIKINILLQP